MAPPRSKKRKSDESTTLNADHYAQKMAQQRIPTKTDSPSAAASQESPRKKRRIGITLDQKQAIIDNLQLEITERARKLRAQYNLQSQGLRTRIEIRVNRIPTALRKSKIADLIEKHQNGSQQSKTPAPVFNPFSAPLSTKPPPVPEKDAGHVARPVSQRSVATNATGASRPGPGRSPKRTSDQISGVDKENELENPKSPKKRPRGHPAPEDSTRNPSKVLSPASSNTRLLPRSSPGKGKSLIARPVSPQKTNSASNILSNLAEKARSTRAAATSRKTNTSTSTASTSTSGTTRGRKAAAATASTKASTMRTARKASGISESSEGSTSTVIKKGTARGATAAKKAAKAPAAKRTVISTIRRGVTGAGTTRKAPAAKAPPASTATGRVLRKRNN